MTKRFTTAKRAATMIFSTLILAVAAMNASAAVIADAAGDWIPSDGTTSASVAGGTAAGWSYFESTAANGGTESALIQGINTGDVGGPGYSDANGTGRQLPAIVGDNANGGDFELFNDGHLNSPVLGNEVLVHPEGASHFVILRYTVSASDVAAGSLFDIDGSFRNLVGGGNQDSVETFVFHNATQLFSAAGSDTVSGQLTELEGTFDIDAILVSAGDTIDFVVGSRGSSSADETVLRATIASIQTVPEPHTIALLLIGFSGVLTLLCRRHQA